jgi:hypothetical protein
MQNYCKTIGALAAASALVAGTASAQNTQAGYSQPGQMTAVNNSFDSSFEGEVHVGYSTQYIFRGLDLGDDLIESGVDVSAEMAGFGLSGGAWYGTSDLGPFTFNELDLYAEVSKDFGFVTAAVGYIYYYYPSDLSSLIFDTKSTAETYFSVSGSYMGFDTSLTYFWDTKGDNDGYMEAYVGKGFELSPCLTLNTGATLGYLWEEGDFSHVAAKVSLDWAFTENATLSPYIAHSWALSDEVGGFYEGSENQFYGGLILAVSF